MKKQRLLEFIFEGVWTELRSEFCLLRQSFTKYFEIDLGNREVSVFHAQFPNISFSKRNWALGLVSLSFPIFFSFPKILSLKFSTNREATHSVSDDNNLFSFDFSLVQGKLC